jgi:hypothetical protein
MSQYTYIKLRSGSPSGGLKVGGQMVKVPFNNNSPIHEESEHQRDVRLQLLSGGSETGFTKIRSGFTV